MIFRSISETSKVQKGFLKLTTSSLKNNKTNVTENEIKSNGTTLQSLPANSTKALANTTVVKIPSKTAKAVPSASKEVEGSAEHPNGEQNGNYEDEESENDPQNNEYSYHDEYFGGQSQGYEFNDNNGEQTGQGYQFNYNGGSMGPPTMQGQSYEFKGGMAPQSNGYPNYMGQGYVSYDDGTTDGDDYSNNNYEKKHIAHKTKGKNSVVKKLNDVRRKHDMKKAKKEVTIRRHEVDGDAYRRTIMIGK